MDRINDICMKLTVFTTAEAAYIVGGVLAGIFVFVVSGIFMMEVKEGER